MEDQELEAQVRDACTRGDLAEAARLAIDAYGAELGRYLEAMLRDDADAADALNTMCEATWKGLPAFRWEAPLRAWMYRLARNAALMLRRDPYRRRARGTPLSELPEPVAAAAERSRTPLWQRTEVKDKFAALRAELDDDDRELLALRVDRGLSWTEVVDLLAEPGASAADRARLSASLRKRFERLKERLRKHLASQIA
ncbi:MAG: sigma factor [Kofleriaceae bacterium]|nr:sigma factor [Kofleriaceae bacterium]